MAGRMEAAARDFAAVHENANTVGDLGDYARLWHHVAEARAGGTSATALIGWQGKGPWPEVLAKLFRGEATAEQVLVAAKSKDARKQRENECIAFFFLAQQRLIAGDAQGAADYFRRTLATGSTRPRAQSLSASARPTDSADQSRAIAVSTPSRWSTLSVATSRDRLSIRSR